MTKSPEQHTVPLNVWLKALILVSIFFWGGYVIYAILDTHRYAHIQDKEPSDLTLSNISTEDQIPDVYFLGSSLTNCALIKFGSFESIVSKKPSTLSYKIVFRNMATLGSFTYKIPTIQKEKPKYLIIESSIVCTDMFSESTGIIFSISRFLRKYSTRLSNIPGHILSSNSRMFDLYSKIVPLDYRNHLKNQHNIEIAWNNYQKQLKDFKVRTINEFPDWHAFFKSAMEADIQVCFLQFPRSKEAQKFLPKGFQEQQNTLIEQFKEQYNILYIEFPYQLDQITYFQNEAHLNELGADYYSSWLINLIHEKMH